MKKLKKILITLLVIILFTIGGLIVESIFNNSNKKYSNVTYAKSINTTSDMQLMARAINGEARGCGRSGDFESCKKFPVP